MGSHVVRVLLEKGYTVHTFGEAPVPGTKFHQWDAVKPYSEYGIRFQVIVHCSESSTDCDDPDIITKSNINGTYAALAIDPRAQFIHLSTASLYASQGNFHNIKEIESEGLRGSFLSLYSESKMISENIVRWNRRPAGSFILRPHMVYGPGDSEFLSRIEKSRVGNFLFLPNGGKSLISLTRVESLVAVIMELIEYKGLHAHGIFNVADREPVVLGDAMKEVLSRRGRSVKIIGIPSALAWQIGRLLEYVAKAYNLRRTPITQEQVCQLGYDNSLDVSSVEEFLGRKMPVSDFSDAHNW